MTSLNKKPLVSIVVATFNGAKYLSEQLNSINSQTYSNIEIIIQDDASTDETISIIKNFEFIFPVHVEINNENIGFVRNFERGLKRANGEYIALCDQDDIWVDSKIELLISKINDFDLIHSDCKLIDESGIVIREFWKKPETVRSKFEELAFANSITGCTALITKRLVNDALPFPDEVGYHDWWLAICAIRGNGIKYVAEALVLYRQHQNQDTAAGGFMLGAIKNRILPMNRVRRRRVLLKQIKTIFALGKSQLTDHERYVVAQSLLYHQSLLNGFFHFKALFLYIRFGDWIRPGYSRFNPASLLAAFIG